MFPFTSHQALKSLEILNTGDSVNELKNIVSRYVQPAYELLNGPKADQAHTTDDTNINHDYLWAQGPVPDTILETLSADNTSVKQDKS